VADEAVNPVSTNPFKGNLDPGKLRDCIARHGAGKIPFVRMEASTNLIGGQPFSIANMREIRGICDEFGIMLVLDASLIGENAYFIKMREDEFRDASCADILKTMCGLADLVYFSARKVSSSRGGGICTNDRAIAKKMEHLVPLFEGFLTYGGITAARLRNWWLMKPSIRSAPIPSRAIWTPASCGTALPVTGRAKSPSCAWKPQPT